MLATVSKGGITKNSFGCHGYADVRVEDVSSVDMIHNKEEEKEGCLSDPWVRQCAVPLSSPREDQKTKPLSSLPVIQEVPDSTRSNPPVSAKSPTWPRRQRSFRLRSPTENKCMASVCTHTNHEKHLDNESLRNNPQGSEEPSISLLDSMHKKFCSNQYKDDSDRASMGNSQCTSSSSSELAPRRPRDLNGLKVNHSSLRPSSLSPRLSPGACLNPSPRSLSRDKPQQISPQPSPLEIVLLNISPPEDDPHVSPTVQSFGLQPPNRKDADASKGLHPGLPSPSVSVDSGNSSAGNTLSSLGSVSPSPPENPSESAPKTSVADSDMRQRDGYREESDIKVKKRDVHPTSLDDADHLFPIDINAVEKDHDFLDPDSIKSLFRRLNALNKCANMKIEAPSKTMLEDEVDDDDEGRDQCALSNHWEYETRSRRWSRRELDSFTFPNERASRTASCGRSALPSLTSSSGSGSSSHESSPSTITDSMHGGVCLLANDSDSLKTFNPEVRRTSSDSSAKLSSSRNRSDISRPSLEPCSPSFRRAASERLKGGARSFLKRVESLKERSKPHRSNSKRGHKMLIGDPVIVDSDAMERRMGRLGCVELDRACAMTQREELNTDLRLQNKRGSGSGSSSDSNPNSYPATPTSPCQPFLLSSTPYENNIPDTNSRFITSNGGISPASPTNQAAVQIQSSHHNGNIHHNATAPATNQGVSFGKSHQRLSVYDNVQDVDAQKELDRILDELYADISGLDKSLQEQERRVSASLPPFPKDLHLSPDQSRKGSLGVVESKSNSNNIPWLKSSFSASPLSDKSTADSFNQHSSLRQSKSAGQIMLNNGLTLDLDPDLLMDRSPVEDDFSPKEEAAHRERRDSGVGSSLSRVPSSKKKKEQRWNSFIESHRMTQSSEHSHVNALTAGQILVLQKLSLLKITAMMEKYSPSNRSGWNWNIPKFMKRQKTPNFHNRQVFGVPLRVIQQRSGHPLPQCILMAMRALRRDSAECVGIFRKSGVRSRIQKLRNELEADAKSVDFDSLQTYDAADVFKQYFRELPECLLTNKLSETFISIFTHMPADVRRETLQAAVMLLPDEHREALQTLLFFLSDIASNSDTNQMTASNLAVCFAPSLFNMGSSLKSIANSTAPTASPRRSRKATNGMPDERDLIEQKSAHLCLAHMISHCKQLFEVKADTLKKCHKSSLDSCVTSPLEDVFKGEEEKNERLGLIRDYVHSAIRSLQKESHDKWKGWTSLLPPAGTSHDVDLSYRKPGEGQLLRLWKACVEVEAPPDEVLSQLLNQRRQWDYTVIDGKVVETLDHHTDVYQCQLDTMAPLPPREICELRSWRTGLGKGSSCALVCTSYDRPVPLSSQGVLAVVYASHYLIEPCGSGRSSLTFICRVDLRGHSVEWYNQTYAHTCVKQVTSIHDSFCPPASSHDGPETNV